METAKHCPNCGKPLQTEVIQGLCPECLIKAGWPTQDSASSATDDNRFVPPTVEALADLFPQLDILELIGQGGMGAVYKARQPDLDRLVALKILAKKDGSDPGFIERFTREARALARLNHPNIVAVYDFGHAAELSYFIMEYVDGTNLRQIERAGGLKPSESLAIIPQICEALQFAHDAGVVHRDIKPENVLLDQKGNVKIADFGLAKILGQTSTDFTLTEPNHVMGTPHYMAPEQVEHPQEVDHRADIFSLGVVFYEMLTGELPLGKFDPPSRKVQIDVRLDEVVLRTLEKEPRRRYQQASQVRTEVETITSSPETTVDRQVSKVLTEEELSVIRDRLRIPWLGVFVAGLVEISFVVTIFYVKWMDPNDGFLFIPALLLCALPPMVLMGASCIRRLKHYGWAVTGASLAMICPIGWPFAIWSLVLLNQRNVRLAFRQVAARRVLPIAKERESGFWKFVKRLALLLVTGFLLLGAGLVTASVVLPWLHRVRFTATHVLGPTVERRFMHSEEQEGQIVFWDLESNTLDQPPFAVEIPNDSQLLKYLSPTSLQDNSQLAQWLDDSGIDLAMAWIRQPNGVSLYLMGVGAERLNPSFQERPFNSVRPAHLIERETCDLRVVLSFDSSSRGTLPASTLCIRTDQGASGVLERKSLFDGVTYGVKIRYKLLGNRSDKQTELAQR